MKLQRNLLMLALLASLQFGNYSGKTDANIKRSLAPSMKYENYIQYVCKSSENTEQKKDEIYEIIEEIYEKIDMPEYISRNHIRAMILTESQDNPLAMSKKGARGLMQLTIEAWKEVDDSDYFLKAFDPYKSIEVGMKYLKWIDNYARKKHPSWDSLPDEKKREIIFASYNGGSSRVKYRGWEITRMPPETRNYISKIERNLLQIEKKLN